MILFEKLREPDSGIAWREANARTDEHGSMNCRPNECALDHARSDGSSIGQSILNENDRLDRLVG